MILLGGMVLYLALGLVAFAAFQLVEQNEKIGNPTSVYVALAVWWGVVVAALLLLALGYAAYRAHQYYRERRAGVRRSR